MSLVSRKEQSPVHQPVAQQGNGYLQPPPPSGKNVMRAAEKMYNGAQLEVFSAQLQAHVNERKLELAGDLATTAQMHLERQAVLSIYAQRSLGRAVLDAAAESGTVTGEGLQATLYTYQRATQEIMARYGLASARMIAESL